MSKSHFIYINSKNRNENEKIYNFNIILNNPIITNRNQRINISVDYFSMMNTDYNLRGVFFKIDEVNLGNSITTTTTINIPDGNYSYISLMDFLNGVLANKIKIEYIKYLNSYKFTSLNSANYDYYIIPFNASKYLGLYNEVILATYQTITYTGSYINLTNYSHIIIKSSSILFADDTQDNINDKEMGNSSILFMIDKQDIQPFQLISYKNNGGDNFSYNINNRQINNINLQLYNENGEILTNTEDYFLVLKIVINEIEKNNNSNGGILDEIKFILMDMMFNKKNKNLILN